MGDRFWCRGAFAVKFSFRVFGTAGSSSLFLPQITQNSPAGQKPFFTLNASSYILVTTGLPAPLNGRSLNPKIPKTALQKRFRSFTLAHPK
jgi:hypothetical protein